MNPNDMGAMASRVTEIVDALTGAFLQTAQTAAEKIHLAAQMAQVQTRMAAFAGVLEAIGVQKELLMAKTKTATGPMRSLLEKQIELLGAQELAVLERIGVPALQAKEVVNAVDDKVYRREGSRFVQLTNGHATE